MPSNQAAEPLVPLSTDPNTLTDWLKYPLPTFANWTAQHHWEPSTCLVKKAMWSKWLRWLNHRSIELGRVEKHHLEEFFKEAEVEKGQRQRYLRLIEKVYVRLCSLGLPIPNPGTEAGFQRLGKGQNDPTNFLTDDEAAQVEALIRCWLAGEGESEDDEKGKKGPKREKWMAIRDAAICSVMVGSGATVWALERLTVNCTNGVAERLLLPRKGGPDYAALALPIAQEGVAAWLPQRNRRPLHGKAFFPADASRRRNVTTDSGSPFMSPSSIFRSVQRLLRAAGITGARACGQTLRNTYGATLIDLGYTDDQLCEFMGFYDPLSAARLRAAWQAFENTP